MLDCEANICHRERASDSALELGGDDGSLAFEPLELLEVERRRNSSSVTWAQHSFPENKKENRGSPALSLRFRKFPGETEGVWCSILETRCFP